MNTETQVAPDSETQNTESVPAETPEVAEPNTTEDVGHQPESTDAKPEKSAEQKELEYLRRKAKKADRNNARLYQQLQELERTRTAPPQDTQSEQVNVDPKQLEEVVSQRAKQIAEIDRLNERCDAIAAKGRKAFPDFEQALDAVRSELPLFDNRGATAAMQSILEADDPPALLHYLGKNPEVASELADLGPIQLTRRLARLELEIAKPTRLPSSAPKPLEPVRAVSAASEPDPKDTERWIAWRNKTAKH